MVRRAEHSAIVQLILDLLLLDSIEKALSTFAAEMATSSMILGLATKESLVLIDEVCCYSTVCIRSAS
jgi:dsDNA-specific endonuclease/ATPase MutS2